MLRKEQFKWPDQFNSPRIRSLLEVALSGIVLCPGIQVSMNMDGKVYLHRSCYCEGLDAHKIWSIVLFNDVFSMVNVMMSLIKRCYKGYIRGTYVDEKFISYTGRTFKFPDEQ